MTVCWINSKVYRVTKNATKDDSHISYRVVFWNTWYILSWLSLETVSSNIYPIPIPFASMFHLCIREPLQSNHSEYNFWYFVLWEYNPGYRNIGQKLCQLVKPDCRRGPANINLLISRTCHKILTNTPLAGHIEECRSAEKLELRTIQNILWKH